MPLPPPYACDSLVASKLFSRRCLLDFNRHRLARTHPLSTDVDTPLLQAGLMGTLHAILDEPAAAKAAEQAKEAALQGRAADSPSSSVSVTGGPAAATPGSAAASSTGPGAAAPLGSPAAGRKAGDPPSSPSGTGGLMNVKKLVAISQHKKKNREHLMRSSPDILDRILAVSGFGEQG